MDIYDTNVLIAAVESMKAPQSFLLNRYFGNVINFDTAEVTIDIDDGKRRISPLVTPVVQGRLVAARGFRSQVLRPGYVKDKRAIDVTRPVRRAMGETIGGNMSAGERELANINFELADQLEMLTRRLELMAADALIDGILTLDIEGLGTVSVDFGRDGGLTVTLLTTARWGEADVSPADDIETWATLVLQKSGVSPNDVVFGTSAWKLFLADPKVADSIEFRRGGSSTIELGAEVDVGGVFKGVWGGFNLFVYNDWYVDEADVEQPMIDAHQVLLGSAAIEGAQHFGAILDPEAGYRPLRFFPKSWVEKDPAQRLLMTQSAPLVAPHRANASFGAKVR